MKNKGYTLLETIIALGILIILLPGLTAMGNTSIESFRRLRDKKEGLRALDILSKEIIYNLDFYTLEGIMVDSSPQLEIAALSIEEALSLKDGFTIESIISNGQVEHQGEFLLTAEKKLIEDISVIDLTLHFKGEEYIYLKVP